MIDCYNCISILQGMMTINRQLKGSMALLAAAFVWGMAFTAQSNAMRYVQPFTFVFLRSTITCAVLLLAMPLFDRIGGKRSEPAAPPFRAHVKPGALIGIFLVLATILQQIGLVYTTPAKSGFVTALYIVIVPIMGIFLGRRVRPVVWLSLALSLTGMVLLCVQSDLSINMGDLFTLGSAFMFSCQIMMVARYAANLDALKLSCVQFATCAVVSGVVAFLFETPRIEGMLACWTSILYVAVFSGALGYTLQMVGQKYADPTLASLLMCLESVFAALGGWLLLGQALSPRELLGCALMLSASVIAQLPERRVRA